MGNALRAVTCDSLFKALAQFDVRWEREDEG